MTTVQEAQEKRYEAMMRAAENGKHLPAHELNGLLPHPKDATHEFMIERGGAEVLCLSDAAVLAYVRWRTSGRERGICKVWYRVRNGSTWDRFPPPDGFWDANEAETPK